MRRESSRRRAAANPRSGELVHKNVLGGSRKAATAPSAAPATSPRPKARPASKAAPRASTAQGKPTGKVRPKARPINKIPSLAPVTSGPLKKKTYNKGR